eukprot:scaffold249526_cov12-Tisochrysis_lutea.AAC.1
MLQGFKVDGSGKCSEHLMDSERSENLQWNASKSDGLAACWPVLARQKRTSIGVNTGVQR